MLTVKDLRISLYDGSQKRNVVEDISFRLLPGESLGIVGESGSGKTITALSILQLLPPGMRISGGEIHLENSAGFSSEISGLGEKDMQAIRGGIVSIVFQEPMTSLNPSMRCGEQVEEAVEHNNQLPKGEAKKEVFSLLKEVHLPEDPDFYRKYPHELSGGQRQRIMIAMALAGNPEVLIADEPTTALDVTVQKTILELLKEIQKKRQMSMLFISHDLGVIRMVCNNVLVMYRGKIVESGLVSDLFTNPKHEYTRGLIACRPEPGSNPRRLPTLADFNETKATEKNEKPSGLGQIVNGSNQPEEEQSSILEVRDLMVKYTLKRNLFGKPIKDFIAVNRVSFNIREGETLGLIGESGCGKSTLGRSIIQLIQSGEGDVSFQGKSVQGLKGKDLISFRKKVQFIFQDPYSSLNPRITAGNSITEVMKVHSIHKGKIARRDAALDLINQVGLGKEHFERYPHEFSGGQRQRIGLARALATGPELIICDESVSSLDVSVQALILNLLNDLKEQFNLTYLFISHDLSVVRYMSDRILVMKDGQFVETGTGDEIFSDPSSDYTRLLIDSILD